MITVSASLHYASWIDYAPPKMCAFYSNFAHSIQIFLNRTRKFAQNLNWILPKKSFWKIEYAHCNDADTVHQYQNIYTQFSQFIFFVSMQAQDSSEYTIKYFLDHVILECFKGWWLKMLKSMKMWPKLINMLFVILVLQE